MEETDDQGRMPISQMSDRELLEEVAGWQRRMDGQISALVESMSKNPMLKVFAGKFGM